MTVNGSQWQSMAVNGSQWQSIAVNGSQWQFEAQSINNQRQPERRRRKGQLRTPHDPILASLESLGFLEILRLFKFEEIITMVSRSGGGASPPSVMALFL